MLRSKRNEVFVELYLSMIVDGLAGRTRTDLDCHICVVPSIKTSVLVTVVR
jgi:hypothetical protein